MRSKTTTSDQPSEATSPPTATFHTRVAAVGLITTVVVLLAACLTFTLQQWAVARAQSHRFHEGLAQVASQLAGPIETPAERRHLRTGLDSLAANESVFAARVVDNAGEDLGGFRRAGAFPDAAEVIERPIVADGQTVAHLQLTVQQPALAPMLPQFIALTFVLLFGGVGVALFLARSLAHRVIQPVQNLSTAMHDVAAGGSFTPIAVDASDELFQSLTESFNHLLAKLAEREDDLKAAMRELEKARDEANAANVLKTQFLANMSHEIRTPLNGVLAMAEVMAMGDLEAVQRDRLDVIRQSGSLLLAVLNDVLDLSKIEAGKLALVIDDFDLGPAMTGAVESFKVMAEAKNLQFRFEVAEAAQGWWH